MMDLNKLLRDYDDCPRTKEYAAHVRNLRRRGNVIHVPRSFFQEDREQRFIGGDVVHVPAEAWGKGKDG